MTELTMCEVFAVVRASGATPLEHAVERSPAWLDRSPAWSTGNLRNITVVRPSELEPEVGTIVRLDRKAKVPVPNCAFLYAGLLPQERRARGEIQVPPAESEGPQGRMSFVCQ